MEPVINLKPRNVPVGSDSTLATQYSVEVLEQHSRVDIVNAPITFAEVADFVESSHQNDSLLTWINCIGKMRYVPAKIKRSCATFEYYRWSNFVASMASMPSPTLLTNFKLYIRGMPRLSEQGKFRSLTINLLHCFTTSAPGRAWHFYCDEMISDFGNHSWAEHLHCAWSQTNNDSFQPDHHTTVNMAELIGLSHRGLFSFRRAYSCDQSVRLPKRRS
jgi:hypothetical protein